MVVQRDADQNLLNLLKAVDVATWCWSVKKHTKKGQSCKVDWKSSFDDLVKAFQEYQLKTSDLEAILSQSISNKDDAE